MDRDVRAKSRLAWTAVVLAVAAWGPSLLRGGFAYDDRAAIFANPVVTGELGAVEAFRRDYWHHRGDAGHYRPLATLSLRLDHALWGEAAFGYHLTNVVLHALVVALAAWTLGAVPGAGAFAFLGLALFAVHPALADSVAWISGRTSMLSALGGAVALAAVARLRRTPMAQVGATLGLLGGLLAKEDAIVFALPVLLLAAARSRRVLFACAFSVAAVAGVYLLMRAGALGAAIPSAPHAPLDTALPSGGGRENRPLKILFMPCISQGDGSFVNGLAAALTRPCRCPTMAALPGPRDRPYLGRPGPGPPPTRCEEKRCTTVATCRNTPAPTRCYAA